MNNKAIVVIVVFVILAAIAGCVFAIIYTHDNDETSQDFISSPKEQEPTRSEAENPVGGSENNSDDTESQQTAGNPDEGSVTTDESKDEETSQNSRTESETTNDISASETLSEPGPSDESSDESRGFQGEVVEFSSVTSDGEITLPIIGF